jgi:hypothetical protein
MAKRKEPTPTKNSERVVVDEIFDDGMARLLRAARRSDITDKKDFYIHSWGEEREDFIESWRVEAFIGYPTKKQLREGDVFFIADGSKLNADYKPIPRARAAAEHLLIPPEKSIEMARNEIKKQYYKLVATQMSTSEKDKEVLIEKVDKKFEDTQQL